MTKFIAAAVALLSATNIAHAQPKSFDPAFDALVPANAKVELFKGGFGFTEGPV